MAPAPTDERSPTRAEFAREVIDALRAAGIAGPIDYEDTLGTVAWEDGPGLDVHALHDAMGTVLQENRLATLAKLARALAKREGLPARWEDARDRVLPQVKRRIEIAVETLRHSPREKPAPRPLADITPHLLFEVCFPLEGSTSLSVPGEAYATWGVEHDVVFRAAAANLERRTTAQWQATSEAPGMYRSPWRDGFDASRIMLPRVFGAVPLRGRPVAVAPTPSMLLFADSESEEGLTSLARFARKCLEREKRFFVLRPIRMGKDGESWEDWLPPPGHPAYDGLRFLRAIEEKVDYDRQGEAQKVLRGPKGTQPGAVPSLQMLQSGFGQTMTVTTWRAGPPAALPKADAIVFRRGEEILGWADWEQVAAALPGELRPLSSYPPRFLAADFPESWQLDGLDLKPWQGPPDA